LVSIEVQSDFQFVRFTEKQFQSADNLNTRSVGTIAYKTGSSDLEALFQGGYLSINYPENTAPPNANGYFLRLGWRGEMAPGFHMFAAAGYAEALSRYFPNTRHRSEIHTMDAELHLAYVLTDQLNVYADYLRRVSYSADGAPFEVVNFADAILEWVVIENLKLRARIQYDFAIPIPGPNRDYYSGGVGAQYRLLEHILLDASYTHRAGETKETGIASSFKDEIVSVGIGITF
jgi:hypothetical protein